MFWPGFVVSAGCEAASSSRGGQRPRGERRALVTLQEWSAHLASAWWRRAAAAGFEHGVDELEDGALVGGRELLDAAQALQEPRGLRRQRLAHGPNAEQLVGGDAECFRQLDQDGSGGLGAVALVVGDHAVRDADSTPPLTSGQAL